MNNFFQKIIIGLISSVLSLSALGDDNVVLKFMNTFSFEQGYRLNVSATYDANKFGKYFASVRLTNTSGQIVFVDCDGVLLSDPLTISKSGKSGYTEFAIYEGGVWECDPYTLGIVNVSAQCTWNKGLHSQHIGISTAKIPGQGIVGNTHSSTVRADVDCLVNLDDLQFEAFGTNFLIKRMEKAASD